MCRCRQAIGGTRCVNDGVVVSVMSFVAWLTVAWPCYLASLSSGKRTLFFARRRLSLRFLVFCAIIVVTGR